MLLVHKRVCNKITPSVFVFEHPGAHLCSSSTYAELYSRRGVSMREARAARSAVPECIERIVI